MDTNLLHDFMKQNANKSNLPDLKDIRLPRLDDKATLKILRDRIDKALGVIKGELGLTKLRTGNIRYERGGTSATIQIKAETIVDGKDKDQMAFEAYHELLGLKPEHFRATFPHRGAWYQIIGIAPSRSKFPVIARMVGTNRRFFFPVSVTAKIKSMEVAK